MELDRVNSRGEYTLCDGTEEGCPTDFVLDLDEEAQRRHKKRKRACQVVLLAIIVGGLAGVVAFLAVHFRHQSGTESSNPVAPVPVNGPNGTTPVMSYKVLDKIDHDPDAFTQGFLYHDGYFYESTGLWGQSTIRKVDPKDGSVLKKVPIDKELFGEGLALVDGTLLLLTWKSGKGLRFNLDDFASIPGWTYEGEGWGLAPSPDGAVVYMSDGTDEIRILDPSSMEETATRLKIRDQEGRSVREINELEYIEGELWANIWMSNRIARIDPRTGVVKAWIDFRGLVTPDIIPGKRYDVLNGIAYDPATKRLWVTGKLWPKVYLVEIRR